MRSLLLVLLAAPAGAAISPARPALLDDVSEAIESAGQDTDALAGLAERWAAEGDEEGARKAWEKILELDPDDEGAHEGLRHHRYLGEWHTTYAALAKARREEARRRFEEDGVVPFGDEWVEPEDLPFRRMGWEQLEDRTWAPPGAAAAIAVAEHKASLGWEQQHLTWIAPEEFELWRSGLWKVGDEWLDTAAANEAHAEIGAWWEIPGEHFIALTTLPEEEARWAVWWADQTHEDLVRMFGLRAPSKPEFVVLDSLQQYNEFAAGSAAAGRSPADQSGWSSIHYAFFTDGWTDSAGAAPVYRGTGAAYYDPTDPALEPFGQHAVRHAAALAWLASVDPSWDTVSRMLTEPGGGFPDAPFWSEKRIPRWMHYGAAAYCERFFQDRSAGEDGNPLWARAWALENLQKGGAMPPVEEVLELEFDASDPDLSARRIHLAGLLMHYALDGGDRRVTKAYDAFRSALQEGAGTEAEVLALEEALVKAQKKIESLAGL